MNEKKPEIDRSIFDILGSGKKDVINGKAANKYLNVFALQSVACNNCKIAFAPSGAQFTETAIELQPLALALHGAAVRQAKMLCNTPVLCITYGMAFMDRQAVK